MRMQRPCTSWKRSTRNSSINLNLLLLDENSWQTIRRLNGLKESKVRLQDNNVNHTCKRCGNKTKANTQESEYNEQTPINHQSTTDNASTQRPNENKAPYSQRKTKIPSQHKRTPITNIVKLSMNCQSNPPPLSLVLAWAWIDSQTWTLSSKKLKHVQNKWTRTITRHCSTWTTCQLLALGQTWWSTCSWKSLKERHRRLMSSWKESWEFHLYQKLAHWKRISASTSKATDSTSPWPSKCTSPYSKTRRQTTCASHSKPSSAIWSPTRSHYPTQKCN